MGFFSAVKKFFSGGGHAGEADAAKTEAPRDEAAQDSAEKPAESAQEEAKPSATQEPTEQEPAVSAPASEEAPEAQSSESPATAEDEPSGEKAGVEVEESAEPAEAAEVSKAPTPDAAPEKTVESEKQKTEEAARTKDEAASAAAPAARSEEEEALTLALRQAEPKLSAWLAVVLDGVEEADDLLWKRLAFLLRALETPENEAREFLDDFRGWLDRMEYHWLEDFRSELQYRLALALDMEDEEDERDRLFAKLQSGLARTRARFGQGLSALMAGHTELTAEFWDEMEELFIMADMGAEPSLALVRRLKDRARAEGVTTPDGLMPLLEQEVEAIFKTPRRIAAVNPPEVILMVGVNGVGKTTTIAKLAHRARMQGKKVMIAAADTFRAAAIEQLQVWAERVGALFHARPAGSDPASVAYEAMDRALAEKVDILFVDTAGRLQTKVNLMEELTKIRQVLGKKHEGAPHRCILVIDATTGQNALSQAKLFKEAAGVDELILTKLDGTAKGGVAIAVAMQEKLPITYVGLGEKLEDLRPFNGADYARALLGDLDQGK